MTAVYEDQASRAISTSGGRGIGSRSFLCEGYDSALSVLSLVGTTVSSVAIPDKGDSHPEFPGLVATDFSISPVANSRSGGSGLTWQLVFAYEAISVSFGTPMESIVQVLPNEIGYVQITSNIRAEFVLAWRKGPAIVYPPSGDGTPDTDTEEVEGMPCDREGNPTSVQRNLQELSMTETVNVPAWDTYRAFRFCRNSRLFLGANPGLVLYRGASVTRTGVDVYQVSHNFIEDENYHLQQFPEIDQHGLALDKTGDGHADNVYWVQPFMNTKDLNLISSNF